MTGPIPFDPLRFRSAAEHYLDGRPAYAPELFERLAQACGLDGMGRLLDLGTGPGVLAMALAPWFEDVLAIDPEPEMLAVGQRLAAGLPITFRQASSQDLTPEWGRFRMVTIGRAFHWMDRPAVARTLDAMVVPGGAVVLVRTDHPAVAENAWRAEYQALIDAAAGGKAAWRQPGWVPHEAVLAASPFAALERITVRSQATTTAAQLVERALSMSASSQARLGGRLPGLRADIAALVEGVAVDGCVTEVVDTSALVARRI